MSSKFILIFYFSFRSNSNELISQYGLYLSITGIFVYLFGLEIHTYFSREIPKKIKNEVKELLRSQYKIAVLVYIFIIPLICLLNYSFFDYEHFELLILLIITEHILLEIYRVLNSLGKPIIASIIWLFKNTMWIAALIIYGFLSVINPISIILIWVSSNLILVLVLMFVFKLNKYISEVFTIKIDKNLVRIILKTGLIFLFSSISIRLIYFFDRLLLEKFVTEKELAFYTVASTFSMLSEVILFSGIISIYQPKLHQITKLKDIHQLGQEKLWISFRKEIFGWSLVISFLLFFSIIFYFQIKGSYEWKTNLHTILFLVIGNFFISISNIQHYALYMYNRDILIAKVSLLSAVISVGLNIIIIPYFKTAEYSALIFLISTFTLYLGKIFIIKYELRK